MDIWTKNPKRTIEIRTKEHADQERENNEIQIKTNITKEKRHTMIDIQLQTQTKTNQNKWKEMLEESNFGPERRWERKTKNSRFRK